MPILLAEGAVDQLLSYLQANLDAKVAGIAGNYPAHPLTLPAIATWNTTEAPWGSVSYPAVEVLAAGVVSDGPDNPAYFGSQAELLVNVIDVAGSDDTLRRRVYRYTTAAFLCVRDMQQHGQMVPSFINYAERGRIITYEAHRSSSVGRVIGIGQLPLTATLREVQ